jgi:hypothetical protein
MIYQIIYLFITALVLGIALANHGKPKEGNHNVWHSTISVCIALFLLYKGGFFDVFFK